MCDPKNDKKKPHFEIGTTYFSYLKYLMIRLGSNFIEVFAKLDLDGYQIQQK